MENSMCVVERKTHFGPAYDYYKCRHFLLTGTLVTIHGRNLDFHGPFDVKIGDSLCPIVIKYV